MTYIYTEYDYLAHHGIKGMRWGVRRYQNEDGSLKSAGKKRYSSDGDDAAAKKEKRKKTLKKVAIGTAAVAGALAIAGGIAYSKAKYDKNIKLEIESNIAAGETKKAAHFRDRLLKAAREDENWGKREYETLKAARESHPLDLDLIDRRDKAFEGYKQAKDRRHAIEKLSDDAWLSYGKHVENANKYRDTANKTVYARAVKPMEKKMVEANKRFSERLSNGQMLRKRRKR